MSTRLDPILPPTYLGILGGGQLGRMFTHAAQDMGFNVCVLDPDPQSPAGAVAQKHIQADYQDEKALAEMAKLCVAVSTEFENVPAQALDRLASLGVYVAPASAAVSITQNRVAEKKFLATWKDLAGIGPAPHWVIEHVKDIEHVPTDLFPGILKTARMGYDGKGQETVKDVEQLKQAWDRFGHVPCVLEKKLPLAYEVSALVARGNDDEVKVYPLAENRHTNGILHLSMVPAPSIDAATEKKILEAASAIIRCLEYVGVLCIEFFILKDGSVVSNEIAPRPHNSGHHTMDSCVTSQFEQQVRAMACLPLGDVSLLSPVTMLNILGDVWLNDQAKANGGNPAWDKVLKDGKAKLHLYGKAEPKLGRKMAHINFLGVDTNATLKQAMAACDVLGIEK